ncbi:MAG TPA: hypothetical protein PLP19_15205 [bacterium]|nr:hypothetical protein [bacterium]HPN44838.1 hypothetical protein [bacterium]
MSIAQIKNDNLSGADEILQQAGHALHDLIRLQNFSSRIEALDFVRGVGKELILSQPRMASLINLVNRVFFACDQAGDGPTCQTSTLHKINNFMQLAITAKFMLIQRVEALFDHEAVIATYSRSSLVMFVLSELAKRRRFSVCLTEARPMLEGRQAAQEMAQLNISVTLAVDAALKQVVDRCDIVLVGADSFNSKIVINKIGTGMLVKLAQAAGKPVYALCTLQKYLPEGINLPPEPTHSDSEIWQDRPEQVTIYNPYFEEIPFNLFTGVITENGIFNAQNQGEQMFNEPVHPWLVEFLGNNKVTAGYMI